MGRRQFDAGVNGFIIQINEKIPFLFLSIVSKRNRKQCLSVSIKLKKHFPKFGITQKSCWTLACGLCSYFLISQTSLMLLWPSRNMDKVSCFLVDTIVAIFFKTLSSQDTSQLLVTHMKYSYVEISAWSHQQFPEWLVILTLSPTGPGFPYKSKTTFNYIQHATYDHYHILQGV